MARCGILRIDGLLEASAPNPIRRDEPDRPAVGIIQDFLRDQATRAFRTTSLLSDEPFEPGA